MTYRPFHIHQSSIWVFYFCQRDERKLKFDGLNSSNIMIIIFLKIFEFYWARIIFGKLMLLLERQFLGIICLFRCSFDHDRYVLSLIFPLNHLFFFLINRGHLIKLEFFWKGFWLFLWFVFYLASFLVFVQTSNNYKSGVNEQIIQNNHCVVDHHGKD